MTHNRRLATSFSLALTSALVLVPGSARAACSQWAMPGKMMINQSNETLVEVDVSPVEGGFAGKARYAYYSESADDIGQVSGAIEGAVDASRIEFTIHWTEDVLRHVPNATGVYTGTIGPQGRLAGTTFDADHPDSKANWWGSEVMLCHSAVAPAPLPARPVIALGRVKPASGEGGAPLPAICEAARSARARNSPAAASLERQCAAEEPK